MSNYVIGYPRSGNNWLENKVRLFFYRCLNEKPTIPQLHKKLIWSHAGYKNETFSHQVNLALPARFQKGDNVTILLRDAKSVIPSMFYHIHYTLVPALESIGRLPSSIHSIPKDINEFALSPWGPTRYNRYLYQLQNALQHMRGFNLHFIYYEDMFSDDVAYKLPRLFGLDRNIVSKEDAKYIQQNSNFKNLKKGTIDQSLLTEYPDLCDRILDISSDGKSGVFRKGEKDSYKEELHHETIRFIKEQMMKGCRLPQYRNKYLK